ncbi:MAG: hypothetical protein ACXVID_04820 [Thermoanaerobaculia bacterium]
MSLRIRGQETFVQLIIDGELLGGSFTKCENFKVTPRADLTDTGFLGETEDEPDIMHHGYDFSFSIHEQDNAAFEVWDTIVADLAAGVALPQIDVMVVKRYRDPGVKPVTYTYQKAVLKLDSQDQGARKDYVKSSFSGKCKTRKKR